MQFFKNFFRWMWRHKVLSGLGLVIILVLVFVFRPKPIPPPDTQTVKRTNLVQSVSVSGSIAAQKQANLSFLSSGPLVYLGAKEGDTVTSGQTIAVIDQRVIEKNLESAAKTYQNQKISYDITNDFNGDRALSDTGLSIGARRQLQTAVNILDQTQLAVDIQQIAKDESVLSAPISGILTRADATAVGMTVGPTTVFSVVDPTSLVFSMDVDEADIGKILVGQPVKISLDAFPDSILQYPVDRIDFVSHTTTNGGSAFSVKVKIPSADIRTYRIGINGNAEIITAEKRMVLTVPITSIIDDKYVYLRVPKGYEKRKVSLGLENDVAVVVTNGLQAGDVVVTQPDKVPQKQIIMK